MTLTAEAVEIAERRARGYTLTGRDTGPVFRILLEVIANQRAELQRMRTELATYKTRVTLGGPPPKCDERWENRRLVGGPEPEFQSLGQS